MNISITDFIPEENYFSNSLQSNIEFSLGQKILKKGRLILYKRAHFCIQFIIYTEKGHRETLEIPFPFKTEYHSTDNVMFFDYRLTTLAGKNKKIEELFKELKIKNTLPSQFYDRILEIKIT
jgi:uncharacterized protein (DUF2225 family)